ncbi:hypothetical protein ACFRR7_24990 [Streptomyces sp. NPDC056909]|uniref:hypothetical protein n=1 Tax=Streptomyces sp. NPDC056909 TaxID=3345963 RepID=UPI0036A7F58A
MTEQITSSPKPAPTEAPAAAPEAAPESGPEAAPQSVAAAEDGSAPAPEGVAGPAVVALDAAAGVVPPMPLQPPVVPRAARSSRRVLRAVGRWAAAVIVFGGLGTGAAFGIGGMERTDVPGLATRDDGRWEYPRLALPALPAGAPRPFTEANEAEIHYADVRELLLPAPAGATADKKLTGGWVDVERYLSEYAPEERAALRISLRDYAVRHIAARGWTMPDGTTSRVYLLRFQSVAFALTYESEEIGDGLTAGIPLAAAPSTELDEGWAKDDVVPNTLSKVYTEPKPYGPTQVRQAYVLAGDTLALIVQEKKGGAAAVPFHQTVMLQNQLLG